jgi:hypothetical protein
MMGIFDRTYAQEKIAWADAKSPTINDEINRRRSLIPAIDVKWIPRCYRVREIDDHGEEVHEGIRRIEVAIWPDGEYISCEMDTLTGKGADGDTAVDIYRRVRAGL